MCFIRFANSTSSTLSQPILYYLRYQLHFCTPFLCEIIVKSIIHMILYKKARNSYGENCPKIDRKNLAAKDYGRAVRGMNEWIELGLQYQITMFCARMEPNSVSKLLKRKEFPKSVANSDRNPSYKYCLLIYIYIISVNSFTLQKTTSFSTINFKQSVYIKQPYWTNWTF